MKSENKRTEYFSLRITKKDKDALQILCDEMEVSMAAITRLAIKRLLSDGYVLTPNKK